MNSVIYFIIPSLLTVTILFLADKKKTILGLKKGWKMFKGILIPFVNILILVSISLYLVPVQIITLYLGKGSGAAGYIIALVVGSVTLIPGPVAYPIARELINQGASYGVVATLMTSLMMVGVVTLPLEIKYFGKKVAILRNVLNFFACLIIGLLISLIM